MKTVLTSLIIVFLLIAVIPINSVQAGSTTLQNINLNNTKVSVSFSYPDIIQWEDNVSFPVSISVVFENDSITYASIWEIKLRLVETSSFPTPTDPIELYAYAATEELSTDPIFDPLYLIENSVEGIFVAKREFNLTDISWVNVLENSVDAKIFFEIDITLLDTNGQRHSRTMYTTQDIQPTVTIQSNQSSSTDSNGHTVPLEILAIIAIIAVLGLLVIIIFFRRRR